MSAKLGANVFRYLLRSSRAPTPVTPSLLSRLRPYPSLPRTLQPAQHSRRCAHSIPKPPSPTDPATGKAKARVTMEPHYELTFTCVPCSERSSHTISKQGYHHGSVLITCPSCRNRHVISDHMNIFGDRKITVEDLMRERGQLVKRGTLGEDGDVEFWEDGTTTERGAGSGISPVARDLQTPSQADQALASHEARDPSAQAAAPSATPSGASSPLGAHGTRPRVDTHASTTPSTRRQMSDLPKIYRYRTVRTLDSDKYQDASLRSYLRQLAGSNPLSRSDSELGNKTPKLHPVKRPVVPRRVASNAPSWFPIARKREEEKYRSMATKTTQMPRDMLIKGKVSLAWDKPPLPRPTWETDGFNMFRKVGTSFDPRPHFDLSESNPADPQPPNFEEPSSFKRQLRSARADEEYRARKEKQRAKEAERLEKAEIKVARKEAKRQRRRNQTKAREGTIDVGSVEPHQEPPNTEINQSIEGTLGMGSGRPSSGLGALEAAAMGEGGPRRQKQQPQRGRGKTKPFRRAYPANRAKARSQIEASAVYAWPKGASKPVKIVSRKASREPISSNASF